MAVARASNIDDRVLDEMFDLALDGCMWHAAREIRRAPKRHGRTLELTAEEVRGVWARADSASQGLRAVIAAMKMDIEIAEAYEKQRDDRVSEMKKELPRLPFIEG